MMRRAPFRHALGSFRVQEITRNDNGEFHPHVHAVLIAPDLAWAENMRSQLLEKFQCAAGLTYAPHCYCKDHPFSASSGNDVLPAMRYALKIPPMSMMESIVADREEYIHFHSALVGRRLISAAGCLRKSISSQVLASFFGIPASNLVM
jgi:hypothetical protein